LFTTEVQSEGRFEEWLQAEQYGKSTCTTQQSQVRRLEKAYGDLGAAFEQDKFEDD
jgi:hypothetical protein